MCMFAITIFPCQTPLWAPISSSSVSTMFIGRVPGPVHRNMILWWEVPFGIILDQVVVVYLNICWMTTLQNSSNSVMEGIKPSYLYLHPPLSQGTHTNSNIFHFDLGKLLIFFTNMGQFWTSKKVSYSYISILKEKNFTKAYYSSFEIVCT